MTVKNQYYWERGNWKVLYDYILHPENYPRGIDITYEYWEDIRKTIYCLVNLIAGVQSEEGYGFPNWISNPFTGEDLGQLKYEQYNLRVAVWNADFNRYIWYVNKNVLYGSDCNALIAPPAAVHPMNFDDWSEGAAVDEDEKQFYPDKVTIDDVLDGVLYKAKSAIALDSDSSHLPPPSNPDWEKVYNWEYDTNSCPINPNNDWLMVASPYYYHDYDLYALFHQAFTEAQGNVGAITLCRINTPAHYWLPQQADPRRQYPPVRFTDTGQTLFQYKDKIRLDKRHLAQAGRLTTPYSSWWYAADGRIAGGQDPIPTIVRKGFNKQLDIGTCHGNQFSNQGGSLYNWPAGVDVINPEVLPEATYELEIGYGSWLHNPNVCAAFYNFVMALLSGGNLKVLADSTFITNFNISVEGETGHEDEGAGWDEIPPVDDMCHGEHCSGIELYLRKRNIYDYYFDLSDDISADGRAYVPEKLVVMMLTLLGEQESTLAELKAEYGLLFAGCYRKIFKYCHRLSPWMRSSEMGVPTNFANPWNPATYDLPLSYSWFGPRTVNLPPISYFDTQFENITPAYKGVAVSSYGSWSAEMYEKWTVKEHSGDLYESKIKIDDEHKALSPDEYIDGWRKVEDFHQVLIDGNVTADLKIGYLVHLCNAETDLIHTEVTDYGHILEISYNSTTQKTTVLLEIPFNDFAKIGWNKNISERHDPIAYKRVRTGTTVNAIPDYGTKNDCNQLAELRDLVHLVTYAKITPTIEWASTQWSVPLGVYHDDASDAGACWAEAISNSLGVINFDVNTWNDLNPGYAVGYHAAAGTSMSMVANYELNPPDYEWQPMSAGVASIQAVAMRITWPNIIMSNLPETVLVRFKQLECGPGPYGYGGYQSSGFLHNYLVPQETPYEELKYHYRYARMGVSSSRDGDGTWHVMMPDHIGDHKVEDDESYFDEDLGVYWWDVELNGEAHLTPEASAIGVVVEVDWSHPPTTVFAEHHIGHIDAAVTPVVDKQAPMPNPPVFYKDPQAYYRAMPPYGTGKITNYTTYIQDSEYNEGDYVLDPSDHYTLVNDPPYGDTNDTTIYYHLYRAKSDIAQACMHPSKNPEVWELIPLTYELRVTAESCECIDDETISEPVKYKLIGDGDAPSGEFLTPREQSILLEEYDFDELFETLTLENIEPANPSGSVTRIYCTAAANLTAEEPIRIKGDKNYSGLWEVIVTGTDETGAYFDIDTGYCISQVKINLGATVIHCIYGETEWLADVYKDYAFKLQAKDSASPIENETKMSEPVLIAAPESWPADLL